MTIGTDPICTLPDTASLHCAGSSFYPWFDESPVNPITKLPVDIEPHTTYANLYNWLQWAAGLDKSSAATLTIVMHAVNLRGLSLYAVVLRLSGGDAMRTSVELNDLFMDCLTPYERKQLFKDCLKVYDAHPYLRDALVELGTSC